MPFTPGYNPDKQSRVARQAQDQNQVAGPLPLLSSGGAPSVVKFDWTNPTFAARDRQARVALLAGQFGFTAGTMPAPALPPGQQLCDLPTPRAASRAQTDTYTQADASEFWMLADSVNPGKQSVDLPPRAAPRARDYSITAAFPLELIGQDAMAAGAQSVDLPSRAASRLRDYTIAQALPINLLIPVGAQSIDLPPRGALRARDYTLAASFPLELIGQDAVNPGVQSAELPPRAAARARDYSVTASFPLELVGQDATLVGQQSTDSLPPRAALRARDYSITESFTLELIGQDSLPVGDQISGNGPDGPRRASQLSETGVNLTVELAAAPPVIPPGQSTGASELSPRAALRARDYSLTGSFPLELIGQDATTAGAQLSGPGPAGALRARDYSITAAFPLTLIGQDATLVGKQSIELSPRAALRARDYSLTAGFPLELIGADAVNPGLQLSGNGPAGPRRSAQLSEPGVNLTLIINQAPPVIPCGLSTAASELAPRSALRARDYSLAASYPLELIGKDQFYGAAGEAQAFDWQNPRGAARLRDYSWIQDPMPVVPMGQSTTATELAPRGAARSRDYSITASFPLELIGQDRLFGAAGQPQALDWQLPTPAARRTYALYEPGTNLTILLPVVAPALPPGQQSTDLSPRAPARSKEYGQGTGFPLELNGKDQIYAASGEVPSYDWPNPRGPQRARSYDWFQSFPLYVFQQVPPGQSTGGTELPPRAALRAKDYTHLQPLSLELYGQDQMYGRPGEVPTYDWQLPTPRAARMQDYSITQTAPYGAGIPPRDLAYTLGLPQSRWTVGSADSRWTASTPVPG